MTLGHLIIGDRDWLPAVIVIVAAAAVLLWLAYRKTPVAARIRWAAAALKITGFALLAIFLVEPLWSGMRARPGANIFLLLADNSRSLTIRDDGEKQPRGRTLKRLLENEQDDWRVRLQQDFDVRSYLVDSQLRRTTDFAEFDFSGTATSLSAALETIRERFGNRPLAGVLLFTDGNATDLDWSRFDAVGLPPIFPVVFGADELPLDVAVENVAVSQTSFEDAPVTIRADVSGDVRQRTDVVVELIDEQGTVVQQQTVAFGGEDDEGSDSSVSVRFKLRPPAGVSFYRVRALLANEQAAGGRERSPKSSSSPESRKIPGNLSSEPVETSEATLANNTRLIRVDGGRGPQRLLYVSGRPNWEFKFLNRAVEGDDQIDLAALIRIAKREAKFDFRGHVDESSNSLYRGFKPASDAETERYDQPVLVRLNMKDAAELRDGFPQSEADLYRFDAIVLDDLEAAFFTADQLSLLERFVSERGGGLLMLGGQESYRRGGYGRTPLGDLLPVYLDRVADARPSTRYRLTLTRDGWLQPWVRLRGSEAEELKRFEAMPEFRALNRVGAVKPGAVVLAHAADESGRQLPALVVQRFGRGRCAAMTVGDLWRWQLKRDEPENDDPAKAWRQMLRWLVADVPDRVELTIAPAADVHGEAMKLEGRIRDREFKPLDDATVKLTITPPSGEPVALEAEPSLDEPGLYRAFFVPRQAGAFRVSVSALDGEGKSIDTVESGWAGDPAAAEFEKVTADRDAMQMLAEKTGGELIEADGLSRFARSLPTRRVPIAEPWTFPLWHQAWVMLLAVGCLAGEWGLRRWKGLP